MRKILRVFNKTQTSYEVAYKKAQRLRRLYIDDLPIYRAEQKLQEMGDAISFLEKMRSAKHDKLPLISSAMFLLITSTAMHRSDGIYSALFFIASILSAYWFAITWVPYVVLSRCRFRRAHFAYEIKQLSIKRNKMIEYLAEQESIFICYGEDAIDAIYSMIQTIRPDVDERVVAEIINLAEQRIDILRKKHPLNTI